MPKKSEDQRQNRTPEQLIEQRQNFEEMEIEEENEEQNRNKKKEEEIIPELEGIENETIQDKNGDFYRPEEFNKGFIPQNDKAKILKSLTLKFILAKKKYDKRHLSIKGPLEVYIINREWYNKWKDYSRYNTIKRVIKVPSTYINRPILYTPNDAKFPGMINNNDIMIRNKINDKDRNILVSKCNDCLDTKLSWKKNFKLLSKERFDLLNDYFKCDHILKAKRIESNNNTKNYNVFCVHLSMVFLPTLSLFKSVNEENIENFKKSNNIIYDLYFKQSDKRQEFYIELSNILLENPQILTNMGVELILPNDKDEIIQRLKNFKFYIPSSKNTKSFKEMTDFIFSNETIELIKNDEKIEEKDLDVIEMVYFNDLNNIFHLNWFNNKDNLDEIKNGIIFVEYIQLESSDIQKLASIFKYKENTINSYEVSIYRPEESKKYNRHPRPKRDFSDNSNLDKFSLNKEKNKKGLVGLNNLGNTCYMNTGLQCLSNCELLTKYFLTEIYKDYINKDNPIGSQGEIVEKYSQLIHHIWYGNQDCLNPKIFKEAFGKMYHAFSDFRQQDTQEFISYLIDALHEDLNKVKNKPYVESSDISKDIPEEEQFKKGKELYLCRNQSFIVDLIYGFYKSTLFCPDENCKNISISFEPFNMITLSLINEAQIRKFEEYQIEKDKKLGIKTITVTFIPFKINLRAIKFPVKIKKEMDIFEFKKKIEAITGFNKNSFEIYKMHSSEFIPIKPNILLLEDFLKGENKIYLFQIPPYVFCKSTDYFDNVYDDLITDHDKLYLEEEKYEGNNLYEEYNKKEKKCKTDDDLDENKNRIKTNFENGEKKVNRIIDKENIEMKDESLHIDKNKWIKAELYNYTYSILESNKGKQNEEYKMNNSRIIYINKDWDNSQVYVCLLEMLEGARDDLDEIKAEWFKDIKETTKKLDKMENKKNFNLCEYLEQKPNHPLFLKYLKCFNFNRMNIMKKNDEWKNVIFPFDSERHTIKKIVDKALENNEIEDIELLFKIIWKPIFAQEYNERTTPIEIEKSEKLDEIFSAQREDEVLKKNNYEDLKEKSGKNKKKLRLEELLKNFNEIEKLSKDNQWFCPKCKQFQLANKKMEIFSVNEVIIIHLKRFRNNRKIEIYVEFPLEGLNLKEYLPNKNEDEIYDLFAVANHVGGLHGGHYFAYCKNYIDKEWYEFNDSHVRKIEKKKVVSDNAYVLFYNRRRGTKFNEEELFKKPLIEIDQSLFNKK